MIISDYYFTYIIIKYLFTYLFICKIYKIKNKHKDVGNLFLVATQFTINVQLKDLAHKLVMECTNLNPSLVTSVPQL
jgi:hypothetical protein